MEEENIKRLIYSGEKKTQKLAYHLLVGMFKGKKEALKDADYPRRMAMYFILSAMVDSFDKPIKSTIKSRLLFSGSTDTQIAREIENKINKLFPFVEENFDLIGVGPSPIREYNHRIVFQERAIVGWNPFDPDNMRQLLRFEFLVL